MKFILTTYLNQYCLLSFQHVTNIKILLRYFIVLFIHFKFLKPGIYFTLTSDVLGLTQIGFEELTVHYHFASLGFKSTLVAENWPQQEYLHEQKSANDINQSSPARPKSWFTNTPLPSADLS